MQLQAGWNISWWRHQMETFSALLAICARNSPVTDEFAAQRPVTRSFDALFDLHLNKQLSKQSWGWWFDMRSLWRYCNVIELVWIKTQELDTLDRRLSGRHFADDILKSFSWVEIVLLLFKLHYILFPRAESTHWWRNKISATLETTLWHIFLHASLFFISIQIWSLFIEIQWTIRV